MVIQPVYDDARWFSDGQAPIRLNGRWGFIDKKGKIIVQPTYESPEPLYGFREGLASFTELNKFGFIDKSWKIVIQPVYDRIFSFSGGISRVGLNGKEGYIDRKGTQYWED